jgi:tryptophan 2,3-dioxygenase
MHSRVRSGLRGEVVSCAHVPTAPSRITDKLLDCQDPQSGKGGEKPAHDETLFIIIHQTYELWFKQVLHEVKSVIDIFHQVCRRCRVVYLLRCSSVRAHLHCSCAARSLHLATLLIWCVFASLTQDYVPERDLGTALARLRRVTRIQKILNEQVGILQTMLPHDFLEFRKLLVPASGFQSVQFRILENRLGIPAGHRLKYQKTNYTKYFTEEHQVGRERCCVVL